MFIPAHGTHGYTCLTCVFAQVSRESIFNKMNSSNLACVFGLNLIWPSQGASSLSALVPLNLFTELLIEYYGKVFSSRQAQRELGASGAPADGQGGPCPPDGPAAGLTRPPMPPRPLTVTGRPL